MKGCSTVDVEGMKGCSTVDVEGMKGYSTVDVEGINSKPQNTNPQWVQGSLQFVRQGEGP